MAPPTNPAPGNQDGSFSTVGVKESGHRFEMQQKQDARIGNSPTRAATSGVSSFTHILRERSTMVMRGSSRGNVE